MKTIRNWRSKSPTFLVVRVPVNEHIGSENRAEMTQFAQKSNRSLANTVKISSSFPVDFKQFTIFRNNNNNLRLYSILKNQTCLLMDSVGICTIRKMIRTFICNNATLFWDLTLNDFSFSDGESSKTRDFDY